MLIGSILKRINIVIGGVAMVVATSALAKDRVYLDAISALTINQVTQNNLSDWFTVSGNVQNRSVAFIQPFAGSATVSLQLTWSINPDKNTTYPQTMSLVPNVAAGTHVELLSMSPESCEFLNSNQSCKFELAFNILAQDGAAEITLDAQTDNNSRDGLLNSDTAITFTVTEQTQATDEISTLVTVPTQCFAYQAGEVNFMANLSTATTLDARDSNSPIADAALNYAIGMVSDQATPLGAAQTDDNGNAYLPHNINHLAAGEHFLFVDYPGDISYKPSTNSGTVGIYYHFVGFQPPINPQGNSIFSNGRVIPVKVKLVDAQLRPVIDAKPMVWIYKWSEGTGLGEDFEPATSVSSADSEHVMRYDASAEHYIYNADLSGLDNGTYAIVVDPNDSHTCNSGPYQAIITVAKKTKKG